MATKAAHKRLTREYATISKNPPPYITAHPSESNILEWHYILTGPPGTPYEDGQYWGTLVFPSDYPFAPPAIRMHTPSGRFRCDERLCLSISDFHPKSFNPAWEVSTILLGVLSFMTGEEMTTGSVSAGDAERRRLAGLSRWDNSTGRGTTAATAGGRGGGQGRGFGAIRKNAGGAAFREQWPEVDEENWKWMEENGVDVSTGSRKREGESVQGRDEMDGKGGLAVRAGDAGRSWLRKNGMYVAIAVLFGYVIVARLLGER